MKNNTRKYSLSGLAALFIFVLFAISILSVLLGGANIYRRLTQRNEYGYDSRTCVQYIATKVRQAPTPDAVTVTAFGDGDSLIIAETIGDCAYLTRIYCHDGWLMELFTAAGGTFAPEDGEKVLPLGGFLVYPEEPGLQVRLLTEDGRWQELRLALRSGEEGLHEK